ncbi:uncharacterized protein LOC106731422 isoform X2 [Pelodiscus sinensis]|uniref:uncharacterized protein LOC106731422 isoform X2 n=1 Tax=Pelodiscus sinensis TaxID=13735 RepID=UPI003F6A5732
METQFPFCAPAGLPRPELQTVHGTFEGTLQGQGLRCPCSGAGRTGGFELQAQQSSDSLARAGELSHSVQCPHVTSLPRCETGPFQPPEEISPELDERVRSFFLQTTALSETLREFTGLSPSENAIQLSVPEGGSLGSPHNISEKSLFMCKCSTSTASCEVIAVTLNGKSQCLVSSICPRVSMTSKYFNVTNASKNDTAVYKIIDALFHLGNGLVLNLTVHDRAPLTPFTSQPPLAREGPRTTTEEGATLFLVTEQKFCLGMQHILETQ